MDYLKILKESLKITWRNKYLWILGLLSGAGGMGISYNFGSYNYKEEDKKIFSETINFISQNFKILIVIGIFILLFILLITIISVIAHGGLIGCINKIKNNQETGLKDGFKIGWHKFWSIFGLRLFFFFLFLIFIISFLILIFGSLFLPKIRLFFFIIFLILFLISIVLFSVLMGIIANLAYCSCVIDDLNFKQSLIKSWNLFKKRWKNLLVIIALFLVISLVLSGLIILSLFILIIPILIIGLLIYFTLGNLITLIYGIIFFILFTIIFMIYSGALSTYTTSVWTLTFLEIQKIKSAEN